MNTPLFLGVILSVVAMTLPKYSPGLADGLLLVLFTFIFILPFGFGSKINDSASRFYEHNHSLGRKLLAVHGIIFLSVFQPFALLWAVDYFLPPFFGEVHNVALIGITVLGGLVALGGGQTMILTMSRMASSALLGIVLLLTVNGLFFHYPIVSSFDTTVLLNAGQNVPGAGLSVDTVVSLAALSIILFWLTWLEMSEVERKKGVSKNAFLLYASIGAGIVVAGSIAFALPLVPGMTDADGAGVGMMSVLVSLGVVAGLVGLFIATAASVGSLFAFRLYPQFDASVGGEKQKLVNKLAVVFSVIVAVMLIPIERSASGEVISWYIGFLAMFTAPIVTAFIISMLVKKQQPFVLSFSIALGGISAAVDFAVNAVFGSGGMDIFFLSVSGALVTAASYAVIGMMKELVVVQRVLSRMNHS